MKFNIINLFILTGMIFFYILSSFSLALSEDEMVRAKIGIQINSEDSYSMAKSKDKLKSGDLLRIYVHPEKASFIYVIYSDKNKVNFLNIVEQKVLASTLVLPSVNEYYQVDGNNPFEIFTIICSPTELSQINKAVNSDNSYEAWAALEKELIQKSKIILTEKSPIPFVILGQTARGDSKSTMNDYSEKKLHIFSGNFFVLKQYEFKVKK